MKEDFLHFLWKHQKFLQANLKTTQGYDLKVIKTGTHNMLAGPDFSDARLKIDDLDWVGNVEIHLKSSDWFAHRHHQDPNYDAVILHVVWEHDIAVLTESGTELPTLELSARVSKLFLEQYKSQFLQIENWIPCEKQIHKVDSSIWINWKERLFIQRIEKKSLLIQELLVEFKNDWEAVCFVLLAKNFGLNINGTSFLEVAKLIPFSVIRKNWNEVKSLEALFMGLSGMLIAPYKDKYHEQLAQIYSYLKRKYSLFDIQPPIIQFNRLRPRNFPTIRWAQLAQLYSVNKAVFSNLIQNSNQLNTSLFINVGVSDYWKSHYIFGKDSAKRNKKTSKSFLELLKINTIIPLKYSYEKHIGNDPSEMLFQWAQNINPEKNSIVSGFEKLKIIANSALDSQSLIELKTNYCDLKKCLNCSVGYSILIPTKRNGQN
jgi:hypothetical protein